MRINLVVALERFVLGRLRNETALEYCDVYNTARSQWANSLKDMLELYRMSPRNAVENEDVILRTLEEIVAGLVTASDDDCVTAGETIVQLSRANAVLLDQPDLNVTAFQKIVDPLEKKIETYKSLFWVRSYEMNV